MSKYNIQFSIFSRGRVTELQPIWPESLDTTQTARQLRRNRRQDSLEGFIPLFRATKNENCRNSGLSTAFFTKNGLSWFSHDMYPKESRCVPPVWKENLLPH